MIYTINPAYRRGKVDGMSRLTKTWYVEVVNPATIHRAGFRFTICSRAVVRSAKKKAESLGLAVCIQVFIGDGPYHIIDQDSFWKEKEAKRAAAARSEAREGKVGHETSQLIPPGGER